MTTAVVFVPSTDFDIHAAQCMAYCAEQGYEFKGLIRDDWHAALGVLASRNAEVVIVARREHIDRMQTPRVEVVSEIQAELRDLAELITEDRSGRLRRRRPRLVQRPKS